MLSKKTLSLFRLDADSSITIPILPSKIKAGGYGSFESPALYFPEDSIDLLKYLIKDKDTTFFGRVTGDSLNGIGIFDKDLLVIQKGLFPKENDTVVVYYAGEFFVKVFKPKYINNSLQLETIELQSRNPSYSNMYITENTDFELWGIVTFNIHKLRA